MRTIITYSEVNAELETTYSPNYRCACKKNAIDGGGRNIYGTDAQFPQNRLIWDVEQGIVYYTITYLKSDGQTVYATEQVAAGSLIPNKSQGTESDNYAATLVNPNPDMYYTPTGWGLDTNLSKKLGIQIKYADRDYTFVSTFNGDSRNDGNVKIFDQVSKLLDTTKTKPAASKSGDVGKFQTESQTGWYSMVFDGNSIHLSPPDPSHYYPDVLGDDHGISPSETERKRVHPQSTDRHEVGGFYSHAGDSIIYEQFNLDTLTATDGTGTTISQFKTSDLDVTSNDLLTEVTFKDGNNNVILHIKVNDDHKSWLRFAIIDKRGNQTSTTFVDMETYDPVTYNINKDRITVGEIPLQAEIQYYIKDNTGNARCGQVEVETAGGDCSYVLGKKANDGQSIPFPVGGNNNKYMTKGIVFFYQLGPDYTGKPA